MKLPTEADWRAALNSMVVSGTCKEVRTRAGLTRAVIARSVGTHPTAIGRWERGERRPTGDAGRAYFDLINRLAKAQEASK